MSSVKRFADFIKERNAIYERRSSGVEKPWTKDKILQQYRFCNVCRERDTVTQWIAKHWRDPNQSDPDLWFAMAVARLINFPDTMEEIGYPVPWSGEKFLKVLKNRKEKGLQLYNGAYMISTHGVRMDKAKYLEKRALTPLWKNRQYVRPKGGESFFHLHQRLIQQRDLGSFMSGQIIADLKYAKPYRAVKDWETFAVSGPGSRRGLNRLLGGPTERPMKESEWYARLMELKSAVDPLLKGVVHLHAQDLQNCLCEMDKYERVRLGEGRPKSLYPGV